MSDQVQSYDPIEQTWVASVPEPFWTTKGLMFWKRFNEKNWLPQCLDCKANPIFKTKEEYRDHYIFKHTSNPRSTNDE